MKQFKSGQYVMTSESVSEGHPDKVCDQISDAILDAYLVQDPNAHVACETAVGPNLVVNFGEVSAKIERVVDTQKIAREVVRGIGYTQNDEGFSADTFKYCSALHGQSPDIVRGVNREKSEDQGAGDQGMMFGYATNETREMLPAPLVCANCLLKELSYQRKHEEYFHFLRPDSKAQVSMVYENGKPVAVDTVVISHQTTEEGATLENYGRIEFFARGVLKSKFKEFAVTKETKFLINPTGKFVVGGPQGDSGLTGRKIIVDTYGGFACHGGGAFSGKDPSKVDRSAAYYARYVAKNMVGAGLADKCQIQVAYAIGVAKPVSIHVEFFGTQKKGVYADKVEQLLMDGTIFDFRPYSITKELGLTSPYMWDYRETACYGHFGRKHFPWERFDKVEVLRSEVFHK